MCHIFNPDTIDDLENSNNYTGFQDLLTTYTIGKTLPYAIRIDGTFSHGENEGSTAVGELQATR